MTVLKRYYAAGKPPKPDTANKGTARVSGFDPASNICWQFGNKGDTQWSSLPHAERPWVMIGRCRSGRRWFWKVSDISLASRQHLQTNVWENIEEHGFVDSEEEAWASIRDAVIRLADGKPAVAVTVHGVASDGLKKLNTDKRAARPAPDTSDAHAVEYLYEVHLGCSLSKRYRIIRKTRERIFFMHPGEDVDRSGNPEPQHPYVRSIDEERGGYIARSKLGENAKRSFTYFLSLDDARACIAKSPRHRFEETAADLDALKAEMEAAHPDKGGNTDAFIAARAAYVAARRALRSRST